MTMGHPILLSAFRLTLPLLDRSFALLSSQKVKDWRHKLQRAFLGKLPPAVRLPLPQPAFLIPTNTFSGVGLLSGAHRSYLARSRSPRSIPHRLAHPYA